MHDREVTTNNFTIDKALEATSKFELPNHQMDAARGLPHPEPRAIEYKNMEYPSAPQSDLSVELFNVIGIQLCVQLLLSRLRPASRLVNST